MDSDIFTTPQLRKIKLGDSTYIHHGLGTSILDGNWNTVSRDLKNDLKEAQPDNELLSIDTPFLYAVTEGSMTSRRIANEDSRCPIFASIAS